MLQLYKVILMSIICETCLENQLKENYDTKYDYNEIKF